MEGGVAVLVLVVDDVRHRVGIQSCAERHEEATEKVGHVP